MSGKIWKVAARNFEASVLDTDDLSTIRGSSLTLLQAPHLLSSHLAEVVPNYREILCAASELIFTIDPDAPPVEPVDPNPNKMPSKFSKKERRTLKKSIDAIARTTEITRESLFEAASKALLAPLHEHLGPEKVAGMIYEARRRLDRECGRASEQISGPDAGDLARKFLSNPISESGLEWPLDLFRFDVVCTADQTAASAVPQLDTALNERQWQRLTCPVPPVAGSEPCLFNTALTTSGGAEKGLAASPSVRRRRRIGREKKAGFYTDVLERGLSHLDAGAVAFEGARDSIEAGRTVLEDLQNFAMDFSDIEGGAEGLTLSQSAKSSLAVIAFDGNGFGNQVRDAMEREGFDGLRRFSQGVEAMSAAMLGDVLCFITSRERMVRNGVARFETLLWGADEFRFVVPGWAACSLATHLHASLGRWRHPIFRTQMTFGMGIAIAKGKTPIADLADAAENLSVMAGLDKQRSLTQVIVFEGVDRVYLTPDSLRRSWMQGRPIETGAFSMNPGAFDAAAILLANFKKKVGLSTLRRWNERYGASLGAKENELGDVWPLIQKDANRIAASSFDVNDMLSRHPVVNGQAEHPLLGFAHAVMLHDYLPDGV